MPGGRVLMPAIGIIDYGMGNLHSLSKAISRVAAEDRVEVTYDPDKLARAEHLVLPGVGGARHCMDELQRLELDAFVRESAGKVPMLGVCLGMQIMLDHSDENGGVDTLGLFEGTVEAFPEPDASLEARPFFESQGFKVVGEQTVERNGVAFRRFAMAGPP